MKMAPILAKPYIEQRVSGYWVEGTRTSLDSVVYSFLDGESPEGITQNFPILSLEQVYGAIAFYLDYKFAIDQYLVATERDFESSGIPMAQANPMLWDKLQNARAQIT